MMQASLSSSSHEHDRNPELARRVLVPVAMCLCVLWVYAPAEVLSGSHTLQGMDYEQLHVHRVRFAQEALHGLSLPGWYSRELLGTPFWSNIQNFPWIPTRLLLLWIAPPRLFVVSVLLSALLAALFAYLYARALGVGEFSAAASGWTFACAGFFASRVMAGHITVLEAYPALPLLLWLVEADIQKKEAGIHGCLGLLALAIAALCVSLAGHPQVPAYALTVAVLYAAWRRPLRRCWEPIGAIALGIGCGAFCHWPMALLAQHSSRFLELETPENHVFFPYARLAAWIFPWHDGWPPVVQRLPARAFEGFPSTAFFWDTVCYVGWLPLVGVIFLGIRTLAGKRRLEWRRQPWSFLIVMGVAALLLALPVFQPCHDVFPGNLFRSPARQLYVTTFVLCVALGAFIGALVRALPVRCGRFALLPAILCLSVHLVDVSCHARCFVRTRLLPREGPPVWDARILREVGQGRVAVGANAPLWLNRRLDDVGFFDSIMPATSYRALLALAGLPAKRNVQEFSGELLSARALAYAGVRMVVTPHARPDLAPWGRMGSFTAYCVPDPLPRAHCIPQRAVLQLPEAEIFAQLRNPDRDLAHALMLPVHDSPPLRDLARRSGPSDTVGAAVEYQRITSDHIRCRVQTSEAGYLRVLESWDPGWSGFRDGMPVSVYRTDGFTMAVPVGQGRCTVDLQYATPGAGTGLCISLAAMVALALFLVRVRHARHAGVSSEQDFRLIIAAR